jgi:hypothetical protein
MSERRLDPVTLAAGLAAIAVGALLALERGGTIELSAGWIAALACAAAGVVLIVSGIADHEE